MGILKPEQMETQADLWEEIKWVAGRHKYTIALVAVFTVVSVYALLQFVSERYEAQAELLVQLGRENVEAPATVGKGMVYSTGVRKEEINSNIQLLQSRSIIESAVDQIGLDAFDFSLEKPDGLFGGIKYYVKKTARWGKKQFQELLMLLNLKERLSDREKIIKLLQQNLAVEHVKDSDVIRVRLRLPDPQLAEQAIRAIIDLYLDRHIEVRRLPKIVGFFNEQVESKRSQLEGIDSEREAIRKTHQLSSIEKQRELLLERLHDHYAKIDFAENERALLLEGRPELAKLAESRPSENVGEGEIIPDPSVDALKQRVTQLHMQRVDLRALHSSDAQPVRKLTEQIEKYESMLLRALNASISQLKTQAQEIEERLNEVNEGEDLLARVERERSVAEESYLVYAKRREEARIDEELNQSRVANVSVLSEPRSTIEPVYPKKMLITAVSIPLGLFFGAMLAVLLEYFNDRIERRKDLYGLEGVTYLGSFHTADSANIGTVSRVSSK